MKSFALLAFGLWAGTAAANSRYAPRLSLMGERGAFAQQGGEDVLEPTSRGLRRGSTHMEFWVSDIQVSNMGVKLGGGAVYFTLMAGLEPGRDARFSFAAGVGGHMTLSQRLWVDLDVTGGAVQPVRNPLEGDGGNVLGQARLMLGFQFLSRLAVFAGPTYNAWFSWGESDFDAITRFSFRENHPEPDQRLQHWPGIQVGLHI
ncbi:peptidase [Myxococcus sp. AM001]|nr:peptidase [Myxococcus sp. AM001]